MKKNTKKISAILCTVLTVLCLSACHDPIFEIINNEVVPETYGLHGEINSIVRFNGYLYTATGYLYRKTLESSSTTGLYNKQWTKIPSPNSKMPVKFLASDSNYLYAYTVSYTQDLDNVNRIGTVIIYYSSDPSDSTQWKQIDDSNFLSFNNLSQGSTKGVDDSRDFLIPFSTKIFDNQAVDCANRNAYILCILRNSSGKYIHKVYRLNGNSLEAVENNTFNNQEVITDKSNENKNYTSNAVYYKGHDYFSKYAALTADENYIYYTENKNKVFVADGWDAANGFTLTGTADGKAKTVSIDCSNIISLGITSDYLLLGTEGGIQHVALNSEKMPANKVSDFQTNAKNILHSPYIITLLFVLDSTKNETATDIYAANEYLGVFSSSTTALFEDFGLWAYYPGRGNWNKDGTGEDKHNNLPNGN